MENENLMAAIQRLQSDTATLLSIVEKHNFTTLSENDSSLQRFDKLEAKLDLSLGVLRTQFARLQDSVSTVDDGIAKIREDIADLTS